jgi:hypothetical protein
MMDMLSFISTSTEPHFYEKYRYDDGYVVVYIDIDIDIYIYVYIDINYAFRKHRRVCKRKC